MTAGRAGWLAATAIAAAIATPALAFQCTAGQTNEFVTIHWETRTVPVAIRSGASPTIPAADLDRIIRQSFAAWENVGCSDIAFAFQPVVADQPLYDDLLCRRVNESKSEFTAAVGLDKVSQVVLVHDCWPHEPSALALTTMTFDARDGTIRFGVVEVNERLPPLTSGFVFQEVASREICGQGEEAYDLGAVLTHEAGHFLGLAHTDLVGGMPSDRPSMTAVVDPCDTEYRSLEGDDVDGVCFIYPALLGSRQCLPLPDQDAPYITSTPFSCASTGGGGFPALALLLVLAVMTRTCSAARSGR